MMNTIRLTTLSDDDGGGGDENTISTTKLPISIVLACPKRGKTALNADK